MKKTCNNCGAPITKEYCEDSYPEVCEHWTPKKPKTNAERIRAMTDEELAQVLVKGDMHFCTIGETDCIYGWHTPHCEQHALEWLKQQAKEV